MGQIKQILPQFGSKKGRFNPNQPPTSGHRKSASIWAKKIEILPQITQRVDENRHFLTSRPQPRPKKADFAPVWVKKGAFQPQITHQRG